MIIWQSQDNHFIGTLLESLLSSSLDDEEVEAALAHSPLGYIWSWGGGKIVKGAKGQKDQNS